ncbi:hypothetical protein CCP4SC76_7490007 [Gammaproteobacteria bacterium]
MCLSQQRDANQTRRTKMKSNDRARQAAETRESEKAMRKAAIARIKAEDQARRVAATEAHIALVNDALRRNR